MFVPTVSSVGGTDGVIVRGVEWESQFKSKRFCRQSELPSLGVCHRLLEESNDVTDFLVEIGVHDSETLVAVRSVKG